jgi:alanine dehydrogenase
MRVITAADLDRVLAMPMLIEAVRAGFAADLVVPVRHHHAIERPAEATATHLLMPAWTIGKDAFLGVKLVNIFPGNGARGLPSVMGSYVLMSGETGAPLAVMDGARLTLWRTAAASGLASRYLSRPDSRRLLMVGAGALAPFLIRAHRAARPIEHVQIWNRSRASAVNVVQQLKAEGVPVQIADDLEAAARKADVISCATLSSEPLIRGAWLKPGAHLDLVGAFTPAMRESDDEAVLHARLFCDTRGGALKEGGDLVQPIAAGLISAETIEADLVALSRGDVVIERRPEDITLYKSAGSAHQDLAAAMAAWAALSTGGA